MACRHVGYSLMATAQNQQLKCGKKKNWKAKADMLRSIGKQSGNLWSSQSGRKVIAYYDVIPSYDRASCEAMIKQV